MSSKWNNKVPFLVESPGNMLSYADPDTNNKHIIWKDDYIFEDTLTFVDYYKGRSAVHFIFEDKNKKSYNMFLSDFTNLIKDRILTCGKIHGVWTFRKQGQNYGIYLLQDDIKKGV